MKTIKEKIVINDEFVKSYRELALRMKEAQKSGNVDENHKKAVVHKYTHICLPVLQMYVGEIEDTINPVYPETAFIVVAVLETMAETIKKHLDISDEKVKSLLDMMKIDTENISLPRELARRTAKGETT